MLKANPGGTQLCQKPHSIEGAYRLVKQQTVRSLHRGSLPNLSRKQYASKRSDPLLTAVLKLPALPLTQGEVLRGKPVLQLP